ncbi:unnamed protein product [Linum tenue]|uniref:1,4-alpha-glucan-branching enzyme 1, chloroplastic/amyloplastic n=1 Tax=Linum tenue TaxID=586396 RepID=A0AAV0PEE9_9ROSI|nr:unnamed protein product [Linum tenue]
MALSLFRFIAVVGRTPVLSNTLGTFALLIIFALGGFVIAKDDIQSWMIWGYYISPIMYGQNAVVINEFLDDRWSMPNVDPRINESTVGKAILKSRGFFTDESWYWICVAALFGFSVLFNVCFIAALSYLNRMDMAMRSLSANGGSNSTKRGMVLPFRPLSLAFNHVNYYVDMPAEMKTQGVPETRLQLLRDVSGAFQPGILTALVGVSGAGKTTLMDVLAGRKTGGYVEGSINISGYPKNQSTFARVSGYCEQNDIHSPYVTVYESLIYSAWLRLPQDIDSKTRQMFVEEVMDLVELNPIRDALVGLPGVDGLSTEQRKRLTIAVELVANPSIIFMDEPTSGLDARAAAIVMRTVRNTVDTGRTVVCTIHQPSIDIFEAFDELMLMKRGGQVIYVGSLGHLSHKLVEYFEAVPGVPGIKDGYNPATWMLEVSSPSMELQLDVDFAHIYANSSLYQRNQELIKELNTPSPGSKDLFFPTQYSQSFTTQYKACFWKQNWSYWRNPRYNAVRFALTFLVGLLFGLIFWKRGQKTEKLQDLMNILGAIYSAVLFLGLTIASSVQPVVSVERTVFYRERAAGMYSALPYAFAQVSIEAIYVFVQTAIYHVVLYSLVGFEWQVGKFLLFFYYIYMAFVYFTLFGMMLIALTPGHQIAAISMSFFLSFWNLFAGFLIPRDTSTEVLDEQEKIAVLPDTREKTDKRTVPPPGAGQRIYDIDPILSSFRQHLDYRYSQYKRMRADIDKFEGGLEKFSRGYEKFGFIRRIFSLALISTVILSETGITYREWAPGATRAALIGDFNNWNPNADVMARDEFGVWEIFLPNNADGSSPIPHGSRVKIRMDTPSGLKDSIPAWIKFAVQAPGEIPYNGIYYDPPEEEKYVFKHPQPKKPKSLRIYESHVGMSSTEPKINTYANFRDEMLPRIKKLGYNAVQIMAIQEHSYYASFGHASNNTLDGLNMFDGTDSHYFHSGSRGHHWMWDSRLFNYGSWEVVRYLLSNARWWLDEFKFDGFRFDGVTSMMYTHHGLQMTFTGNYNEYFGFATDVDAVVYLMLVNDMIHGLFPEAVSIGEDDMYDFMALDRPATPLIDRGIALHKMIRLITMALGGEGYLNFMGNEFGHPEWIDFPRGDQHLPNGKVVPGNNNSFDKCRRRFDLGDAEYLRYHGLQEFDRAMHHLEGTYGFMTDIHQYISRKDEGDRVIVFERGNLVFVFNFHWNNSYSDYRIGCHKSGKYKIVLDSDDALFGGFDRLDHNAEYFTFEGWYDDRPRSIMVYAPARTAVVYALVEDKPESAPLKIETTSTLVDDNEPEPEPEDAPEAAAEDDAASELVQS